MSFLCAILEWPASKLFSIWEIGYIDEKNIFHYTLIIFVYSKCSNQKSVPKSGESSNILSCWSIWCPGVRLKMATYNSAKTAQSQHFIQLEQFPRIHAIAGRIYNWKLLEKKTPHTLWAIWFLCKIRNGQNETSNSLRIISVEKEGISKKSGIV